MNQVQERENIQSNVSQLRTEANTFHQSFSRIVHQHLNLILQLQRRLIDVSDQIQDLPELPRDEMGLDSKLQSNLNPNVIHRNLITDEHQSSDLLTIITTDRTTLLGTEPNDDIPIRNNDSTLHQISDRIFRDANGTTRPEISFHTGQTDNIERRNPITIPVESDKSAGTICCHENQLIYNDYYERSQRFYLKFLPDVTQSTTGQTINWLVPSTSIGGGDDEWIQDMAYSNRLGSYLLLNRSRLRILHENNSIIEEFYQFPDRSMKRVTCDDEFIYLISAASSINHNGDEIILLNYDREEKICKTFRSIMSNVRRSGTESSAGEFSDLAVNANGYIMLAYRIISDQQVGVCLFKIEDDGNRWSLVKRLRLSECWRDNLSCTPRMEWCEKLNVFTIVEYVTGHLIMINEAGELVGECLFHSTENQPESPLNISISSDNILCVRYRSSIHVYKLNENRV